MHLESLELGVRSRLVAAALASALGVLGLAGPTHGAGKYAAVEYFSSTAANELQAESAKPTFDKNSPFYFDGTISRQTLENYLDRAITMGYFLVPGRPEGYQFPYRDDDVRMIHNLGAKFIGRAIYRWGEESKLGDPAFLEYAKKMVDRVHTADPEVVFQGCLFEQVSADIDKLKIPVWVFAAFGLPIEDRTFSCAAIIKREGRPGRGGRRGGVPIINNLETRLWFYYLAVSYINIGCEAFHLGQVGLIGADDKELKMPGTRMITCPNDSLRTYFANTRSPACPVGYSQEETIKKIWNHQL